MKSGKCLQGQEQTVKMIRQGQEKLVTLSNNCPSLRKSETVLCHTGQKLQWKQYCIGASIWKILPSMDWLPLIQGILISLEAC